MDTADAQQLSRLSKMLLAGIGVAFAWVLLSFALGIAVTQAHADDDNGLLGTVTSAVDDTASAAAATVVQAVASPGPGLPIPPVVDVIESATTPVLTGVTGVTESGIVAPVLDPALEVVTAVPVVGGVVSALQVDGAAASLGTGADGVLHGATGAVAGLASEVVDTAGGILTDPAVPPPTGLAGSLAARTADAGTDAVIDPLEMLARAAYLTGASVWLSLTSDLPAALSSSDMAAVSGAAGGVFALVRSVMQADSVLVGPGGAGPGVWVLVALGLVVAYRAWVRRSGLENAEAPPAPALSTDVSPD